MSTTKPKDVCEQDTPTFQFSDLRYIRSKEQEMAAAQIIRQIANNYAFAPKNSRDRKIAILDEMLSACRLIPYGEETKEHQLISAANRHFIHLIHLLEEGEEKAHNIHCASYEDIRNFLLSIKQSCKNPSYSEAVTWRLDCFLSALSEIDGLGEQDIV